MYLSNAATSVVPIHLLVCTSLPFSSAQPLGSYPVKIYHIMMHVLSIHEGTYTIYIRVEITASLK